MRFAINVDPAQFETYASTQAAAHSPEILSMCDLSCLCIVRV